MENGFGFSITFFFLQAAVVLDRMVVRRLVDQTDTVVTVVIIFLGLLLTISVSVFTAVQVKLYSIHVIDTKNFESSDLRRKCPLA